jgi:hypothetical protein
VTPIHPANAGRREGFRGSQISFSPPLPIGPLLAEQDLSQGRSAEPYGSQL